MKPFYRNVPGCLATLLIVSACGFWQVHADDAPTGKPKLAVVVVFDQFRGDYLEKWKDLFGEGGFRRLQTEGAWFTNCHYPYADTLTAAGHTSLVTGTSPYKHGIIANEWYDRQSGADVTAVQNDRYDLVLAASARCLTIKASRNLGAWRRRAAERKRLAMCWSWPARENPRSARCLSRNERLF